MDAFDRVWRWAEKPLDSPLTIPPTFTTRSCRCRRQSGAIAPPSTTPCARRWRDQMKIPRNTGRHRQSRPAGDRTSRKLSGFRRTGRMRDLAQVMAHMHDEQAPPVATKSSATSAVYFPGLFQNRTKLD